LLASLNGMWMGAKRHNRRRNERQEKASAAVRRILRKYGYPPDLEDAAIRTVVLQAEALAAEVRG